VGSPWAIGGPEGGHKAVHPELGTLDDLRALVKSARAVGIEVALDIALQASPDHPYVKEHPEWFLHRADGSIQYAENPPKKYQDVYPFDFECAAWESLWLELASIFHFWCEQGVRVFRVDNPHTKPVPFWEWCIADVKSAYPEAVFLAEAFTRPKVMYALAKSGFTQSYTYFTWRHSKREFVEYMQELTRPPVSDFFRPNFWPNTPDILPEHLQFGNRATFVQRLILAATLSSNYGIYGPPFELMERAARAGSEEYADNEKYQLRAWDLDREDSLRDVVALVNRIRRETPALQDNLVTFHPTDDEYLLAYSKRTPSGDGAVLVVVNLDAHHAHAGALSLDLGALGVAPDEAFQVHDLLADERYRWQGARAYVSLDPVIMPASIFVVKRRVRTERDFDYFA
jgi:starch synthase (maltosyl-transferring)